jgi:hypothetical protein
MTSTVFSGARLPPTGAIAEQRRFPRLSEEDRGEKANDKNTALLRHRKKNLNSNFESFSISSNMPQSVKP